MHHASIRTANIHLAIAFYEQLGFTVGERFTTGYTLACWLEGLNTRIELIQIPQPKPAPDAFDDEHYVGYYHLAFDLSQITPDLPTGSMPNCKTSGNKTSSRSIFKAATSLC